MCVAAVIFKPVSLEDHEAMECSNPHGGGVAWMSGGMMEFRRGLTAKEIHALQESGEMTYPYLLHYRWATHGAKVPQLTHPFPVGPRALFGELSGVADKVLIHNGTWSSYEMQANRRGITQQFGKELVDEMSDTAIAAYIADSEPEILDSVSWATCLGFVNEKGALDVRTTGTWYERGDSWFSNLSWEPGKQWWSKYTDYSDYRQPSHSLWDDDSGEYRAYRPYKAPPNDPLPNKDLSWEDYLRAKYGWAEGPEGPEEKTSEPSPEEYEDIGDYLAACLAREDAPSLGDLISDDPETVNAAVGKMMA